jgi:hypothetical protein
MQTAIAFRLPNCAIGQTQSQLIECKSARPKCDVSLEQAKCRDKDTIDTLSAPFQTCTSNPDIGCNSCRDLLYRIDLADEAVEHADEAMDGHCGLRRTESGTSFNRDQRSN